VTIWRWYWLVWVLLGFGLPETVALLRHNGGTLSATVWYLSRVDPGHATPIWQWTFAHLLVFVLLVWLIFHFCWGLFR
jgi:hypothetical protein